MKIIVAGSRSFDDADYVARIIANGLQSNLREMSELVSGGACGVDSLAMEWAKAKNIPIVEFLPDYAKFPGKIAPLIRNECMAMYADALIAIWNGSSSGTANMIAHMAALDKPIYILKLGALLERNTL